MPLYFLYITLSSSDIVWDVYSLDQRVSSTCFKIIIMAWGKKGRWHLKSEESKQNWP